MFRKEDRRLDINIKSNIEKLSDIKEAFKMLSDPLDMITYLIDLGKNSHNMNDEEKNDNNIIKGCTSQAWLMVSNVANEEYYIKTDSDSHIVKKPFFSRVTPTVHLSSSFSQFNIFF